MVRISAPLICFLLILFVSCKQETKQQTQEAPETNEAPPVELTGQEYAQLGTKALYMDWEFDQAKEALLKAVEINDKDAMSHANLAWYWMLEGNRERSMESIDLAKQAAPDSALLVLWHGWICYFYDDFECADKYLRESIAMQPEQRDAYFVLGRMNYRNGNKQEALEWLQKAAKDSTGRSAEAMYLILTDNDPEAREIMNSIETDPESFELMVMVALKELSGNREEALTFLEKNYEMRQPLLPWLRYMPILRPLHEEPRFQEMVAKIGGPSDQ